MGIDSLSLLAGQIKGHSDSDSEARLQWPFEELQILRGKCYIGCVWLMIL